MNNMFKSSDLLKELAPSQGEAVYFIYFSHMAEKISLILNWGSPVSGKFGHLQEYLRRATFVPVNIFQLHDFLHFKAESDIFLLLPSFEDFRAYALAEYTSSIDKLRGEWGRIARSLRYDFVRGYHYYVINLILIESLTLIPADVPLAELTDLVRDITNVYLKHGEVTVGRRGFGHLRSSVIFRPLMKYGVDPDLLKDRFNYHARRFTVLPFGPLVSDIEHVFRINSLPQHD